MEATISSSNSTQCPDSSCDDSALTDPTELSAIAPSAEANPSASAALELCGIGPCLPDDQTACAGSDSPPAPTLLTPVVTPAATSAPDASLAPDGGVQTDGGLFTSVDAGSPQVIAPAVDSGFSPSATPDAGPQQFGCQLIRVEGSTNVARQCAAAGSQGSGEACSAAADCSPGLGCVGTSNNARCLPYCCAVDSPCGQNAYCTHRPLFEDTENYSAPSGSTSPAPLIPVCEPLDGCSLSEPFPCPTGQDCSCSPEEACTVVRSDGATACTRPSPTGSEEGGACPCLAGLICSQASEGGSCRKICSLDEEAPGSCGSGLCQASGGLPSGWGICVGSPAESSR